jgi:glycosyltransferase involved in cell wall biosynthesis
MENYDMTGGGNISVAVPWSLSHYIPLNGFSPLYRALVDHAPDNINLFAWDNVKLHRRICSDSKLREALLNKAKAEQYHSERLARESIARAYREHLWPPNYVLTTELMGDIEFHHTAPFPSLKRPFVFHCESYTPVLFPFAQQGTDSLEHHEEIREHYQGIFANPLCLGIFSHIPETLQALSQFFSDPIIDQKLLHSRIGLSEKVVLDPTLPQKIALSRPRFLFVNSAHQNPANFFCRGGHIALRFWKSFLAEGNDGLLLLCCAKPSDKDLSEYGVDVSFLKAQTGRSIIWGQDYLANHEMNALIANAHFLLSPSASLQSVSIMQAMTLGTIPVVTDTVGMSVYVTDNENGIVLQGIRGAVWHKEAATGILVDRYFRTPDLDDSLVSQLTSRVGILLDAPDIYWNMRDRTVAYAQDQFSGQAFSDHFWGTVSDLYHRERKHFSRRDAIPTRVGAALLDCTVQDDSWARVFESPTQPMLRINTGLGVVWALGGAMIQAYGNPRIDLNGWSVLAQHYSPSAPQTTFANTLDELGGKYLHPVEPRWNGAKPKLIGWIARVLKPFPTLYRFAARVLSRFRSSLGSRFSKAKANPDIELIRHGVSGYNIIRHLNRYYAIPQNEGEFFPHKADTGGYSSCFSDFSVDEVQRRIAGWGPSSLQASLADDDLGQIELVCEGFHGFKVIRRGNDFHAILQCEGPFVAEKLRSKQYSRSFSGYSLEEVQRAIVDALDSEPGLADSYPQSADRVSKS